MIKYSIMLNSRRLFSFMLMALFVLSASAAQDSGEAAPRQNRPDLNRFKTVYDSDGLQIRKTVLKEIGDIIAQGDISDDIYATLEYMSMEGLKIRSSQLQSGFPEIRELVAEQYGKIGTAKATDLLILLCNAEQKEEYYVLQKTIRSLGDIGINENDKTVRTILGKVRVYNPRSPDSSMERVIISAIYALDKIDQKNDGIKSNEDFREVQTFLDRVNKGHFTRPVQEYAKKVMEEILRRDAERNRKGT